MVSVPLDMPEYVGHRAEDHEHEKFNPAINTSSDESGQTGIYIPALMRVANQTSLTAVRKTSQQSQAKEFRELSRAELYIVNLGGPA